MAKAYARAPVLTVNGSDDGFDGFRLDFFINHINDEDVHPHLGWMVLDHDMTPSQMEDLHWR